MKLKIAPQKIVLSYNQVPAGIDAIPPADLIVIRCEEALLQRIELSIVRDERIPEPEQIRWAITGHISQALEMYAYDIQVFVRTETEIKAIACLIEKKTVDGLRALVGKHNPNIARIESEDGQFCFEKKNIPWYSQKTFCEQITKLFLIYGSIASAIFFLGGLTLLGFDQNQLSWMAGHAQELKVLEEKELRYQAFVKKNNQIDLCQKENKKCSERFLAMTKKVPSSVSFTVLRYDAGRIEIEGTSDQVGLRQFAKAVSGTIDRSSGSQPLAFQLSLEQKVAQTP